MEPRPLCPEDLPRAAALSALVGWNQVAADWAVFQAAGAVRALDDGDPEALAATAATLPYGARVAWISMVLVRPDRRRRGLATGLMRWAVEALHAAGTECAALDATPEGRPVYAALGFRPCWGLTRWALPSALPGEPGVAVRPLGPADWPAVLALDAAAFGADRGALLRGFAARLPVAALVAERAGRIVAALLGRDGQRGPQLGPLLARDAAAARALLAAARAALPAAPAVLDLRDDAARLAAWLEDAGGRRLRPFTRMALGADLPGDPALMPVLAGPEFG